MANYYNQYSNKNKNLTSEAINKILGIADKKQQWTEGYNADLQAAIKNGPKLSGQVQPYLSNSPTANKAHKEASPFYDWLRQNGMEQIAGNIENMDANQTRDYAKRLSKTLGKTQIRPYLYSLGEQYGLSQDDVDKVIQYNEATGEVSLGGRNLGTPDAEVDGTTYWDANMLNDAFADYADRAGLQIPLDKQHNKATQNLMDFYTDLYKNRIFADPYSTEAGKSIMENYGVYGKQAHDNALAGRAASNGGNIDSFGMQAANLANALWKAKGHEAVLAQKNADVQNAIQTLQNMGVDVSRISNDYINQGNAKSQWETDQVNRDIAKGDADSRWKTEAVNRDVTEGTYKDNLLTNRSARTGLQNPEDLRKLNPYLDENGNVTDDAYNGDLKGLYDRYDAEIKRINKILTDGKTEDGRELTAGDILALRNQINDYQTQQVYLSDAREAKRKRAIEENNPNIDMTWFNELLARPTLASAAVQSENKNLGTSADMSTGTNKSAENIAGIQAETDKYKTDVAADTEKYNTDAATSLASSSGTGNSSSNTADNGETKAIKDYADAVNEKFKKDFKEGTALKSNGDGTYSPKDANYDYIIARVMEIKDLSDDEKISLLLNGFGITKEQFEDYGQSRRYK